VADISQWRKTLLTLPDSSFFELVRNYLGEIQTPFNKQSLLDRLQTFLRRPATQRAIVDSVDTDDARFLSAVKLLGNPSRDELLAFLGAEYTRLEIQNRLLNLQDRLLVFPDAQTDRLHLNPILEPVLAEGVVGPGVLFPSVAIEEEPDAEPWLTDTLLAAVFALLMAEPLSVRNDGRLKKRDARRLSEAAPQLLEEEGRPLSLLRAALAALGLTSEDGAAVRPLVESWRDISRLSRSGRLAVVWAAAATAAADATSAADAAEAAPSPPADRDVAACALRTTLLGLTPGRAVRDAHLLQLLEVAATRCGGTHRHRAGPGGDGGMPLETVLDRLCELGVLAETGDHQLAPTRGALELLRGRTGAGAAAETGRAGGAPPGVVTPSYQLTLRPTADLATSLPAVAAARLVRLDRYCEYEIDRDAVIRAFRAGFRAGEITEALETLHGGPLPQNVRFSISTWRDEYERVELLDGVVLLIDESHAALLEHSPQLGPYLRRRLGPGAFLLSREEEPQWRQALEQAGLGAVPAVQAVGAGETPELTAPRFAEPPAADLRVADTGAGGSAADAAGTPAADGARAEGARAEGAPADGAAADRERALRAAADAAGLGEEQRREVLRRIERKLILVPDQITGAVVPREMPEARGLDYVGKVRLIEQAIARGTDYLEIVERGSTGGPQRLFIRPRRLDKKTQTLLLHGETVGEAREVTVRVDKIGLVRVVRGTLFVR
jgi:hypothetical protein